MASDNAHIQYGRSRRPRPIRPSFSLNDQRCKGLQVKRALVLGSAMVGLGRAGKWEENYKTRYVERAGKEHSMRS